MICVDSVTSGPMINLIEEARHRQVPIGGASGFSNDRANASAFNRFARSAVSDASLLGDSAMVDNEDRSGMPSQGGQGKFQTREKLLQTVLEQHEWELAVNKAIVELADALINPSSSIEEIADIVLQQARQLTHSEHGYVASVDEETRDLTSHTLTQMMGRQCRVAPAKQSIVFHLGPDGRYPGLWGHAMNRASGFYSNTPDTHPASTGLPEGHIPLRNFLTIPALVGEEVVGQIALANADEDYCDRHLEAVGRIAKLYALAVQRWRGDLALKNSEERYALAQMAANIGSWDWNISTGKLVWSGRIEPMFGFAKGQFKATYEAFLECLHPDDRQLVEDSVSACIENREDYHVEHRIIWPDGKVRWVSETGDVVRDSEGKAVRMLGVVQDITERKQAELQVRDLAKFASENPSPVLRIRRDGIVLYSNRPGQALMRKWGTQPGRAVPEKWNRHIADICKFNFPRATEVECESRVFSLVLVPVVDAGYVNIYGRDITDHKKAEYEIRKLNEELEKRVLVRTRESTEANRQLRAAFKRRRRLEGEILEISEREQRRIGRELHDSLGQQLTGIAIMTKALEQTLQRQARVEAADAKEIATLVNQAVEETRQLSRGLHPVALDENGLMSALQALAATTQNLFRVSCVFHCDKPVLVPDASTAAHLYRIAQEAVTNAVRHGMPQNILIELSDHNQQATLLVTNDGQDFPENPPEHKGMGLQVMSHRAEMIGGTVEVHCGPSGGTELRCCFSVKP
jgi:PAS domain S-box-containing protein